MKKKVLNNEIKVKKNDRILYLDMLRVLAVISVIILHVSAQNWYSISVTSYEWKVLNFFDSAVRWSVPVFVMISGALFLDNDKTVNVKNIYKKNILRMITAFAFWSFVYAFNQMLLGESLDKTIALFIKGHYHMWFLFMICGLYIVTPILRKITESKKITEYFLIIGLLFTFLIPRTVNLFKCLDISYINNLVSIADMVFEKFHFHLTLGYVFYFVLGFYLSKYDVKVIFQKIFYFLSIIGFIATFLLTQWYSIKIGTASDIFYSYFSINVMLMAIGIFLFAKYYLSRIKLCGKKLNLLLKMSNYSFGVYLVHVLVLDKIKLCLGLNTLSFEPIFAVIVISILVMIISYIISFILNQIPVLKKYVV